MNRPALRAYQRARRALRWARYAKREAERTAALEAEGAAAYWTHQKLHALQLAADWRRIARQLQRGEP